MLNLIAVTGKCKSNSILNVPQKSSKLWSTSLFASTEPKPTQLRASRKVLIFASVIFLVVFAITGEFGISSACAKNVMKWSLMSEIKVPAIELTLCELTKIWSIRE